MVGGYALGNALGFTQMGPVLETAASLLCIGGIAGLATQKTARLGNTSGVAGITLGLAATLGSVHWDAGTYAQFALVGGGGAAVGLAVYKRVDPTSLPQTVAAFHSLVGAAAVMTAIGDYSNCIATGAGGDDAVRLVSIGLATAIGGVTTTGSLIAFAKLNGNLSSAALKLPVRDALNASMAATMLISMAILASGPSPAVGITCLGLTTVLSAGLGLHMVHSIGGADMPVVITVLNSYSVRAEPSAPRRAQLCQRRRAAPRRAAPPPSRAALPRIVPLCRQAGQLLPLARARLPSPLPASPAPPHLRTRHRLALAVRRAGRCARRASCSTSRCSPPSARSSARAAPS